jgi:hypothetical protein
VRAPRRNDPGRTRTRHHSGYGPRHVPLATERFCMPPRQSCNPGTRVPCDHCFGSRSGSASAIAQARDQADVRGGHRQTSAPRAQRSCGSRTFSCRRAHFYLCIVVDHKPGWTVPHVWGTTCWRVRPVWVVSGIVSAPGTRLWSRAPPLSASHARRPARTCRFCQRGLRRLRCASPDCRVKVLELVISMVAVVLCPGFVV